MLPTTVRFRYTTYNKVTDKLKSGFIEELFQANLERISRVHVNRPLMAITPLHISVINTKGKMVWN